MTQWRALTLPALAELLAITLWFSASAVVPSLELVWGLTVVADSAQISAAITELSPPESVGNAAPPAGA